MSLDVLDMLARVDEVERGVTALAFTVPLPVERLPRQATNPRELARKVALVMSLQLEDGVTDAVPISARFAARLLHLADPEGWGCRKANTWLKALERWDVIRHAHSLPGSGSRQGARCYQPGDRDLSDIALDGLDVEDRALRRLLDYGREEAG